MTTLEIISRLCGITTGLSEIVRKQQETIERSKVEEAVKEELRQMVDGAERELDVMEYHLRRIVERQIVANPNIKLNLSFFTLFPQIIPAFSSIPSDYS